MVDVTIFCFFASYTVAFALDVLRLKRSKRSTWMVSVLSLTVLS